MQSTSVKIYEPKGYTLIELAIVMIVVGLLVGPAIGLYKLYQIDKREKQIKYSVEDTVNGVGGFQTVYGRYPCPSPLNALPEDPEYGHEVCDVDPDECVSGVCNVQSEEAHGRYVLIGGLPFRKMNLQENQVYDGRGNRLRYAVTASLTDIETFNPAEGGVSILDTEGRSLVDPPGTAQFAVVSSGANDAGGVKRSGGMTACPDGEDTLENENCDDDTVFRSGETVDAFDDKVIYASSMRIAQWQISEDNEEDIHTRNSGGMAVGVPAEYDFERDAMATIHAEATNPGFVIAEGGKVITSKIHGFGGSNDMEFLFGFEPELIGGNVDLDPIYADAGGYVCPDGMHMYGISSGRVRCASGFSLSCPEGEFITGFTEEGHVMCGNEPPPPCEETTVTTMCGDNKVLPAVGEGQWSHVYTGTCYTLPEPDDGDVMIGENGESLSAAEVDVILADIAANNPDDVFGAIQAWVAAINNQNRIEVDCDTNPEAQIRESYQCVDTTWSNHRASEKGEYDWSFPGNPMDQRTPEIGDPPDLTWEPGEDPNNTGEEHDCWCREDYRVREVGCGPNQTGNRYAFDRHSCPQTSHNWTDTEYPTYVSGALCECAPGADTVEEPIDSCNDFFKHDPYDVIDDHMPEDRTLWQHVYKNYDLICGADGQPEEANVTYDASRCYCNELFPMIVRHECEPIDVNGNLIPTTNDWTWSGGDVYGLPPGGPLNNGDQLIDVARVTIEYFTCPEGTDPAGDTPLQQVPNYGGYYEDAQVFEGPACVCTEPSTWSDVEDCPEGQEGTIEYVYEQACDAPVPTLIDTISTCRACVIQPPAGGGSSLVDYPDGISGLPVGSICDCESTDITPCWEPADADRAFQWSGGCFCN